MSANPIDDAVRELVDMLQTSGTVSGDRIYFPERRTRELLSVVRAALTAAQQQGHPASEYVGATAKARDCTCQRYDGRDCRKCFRPPYPDQIQQQGQAVAWMTPESIAHLAKQNGPAKVDAWNCASGTERVPLYTASPNAPVGVEVRTEFSDEIFAVECVSAQQPATVDEAAAQASEIEAMRAEVERLEEIVGGPVQTYDMLKARAERLAEALRLAEEHINALTPEWYSAGQRVLAAIRAALEQEGEG
jgi:hypothetical protein